MTVNVRDERALWWSLVAAIAVAALLLRIFASRGGLWTDEAWSMIYAEQARDPIGIFLRINHDNNHHLNSLWLQLVGLDAPPRLARLPAAVTGAASSVVAALYLKRRSALAGLIAAILFAVSPIMLNYGSEARGYAMMVLAALTMLLLVTRALEGNARANSSWWLALVSLLGMLSHMTMGAIIGLVSIWVYLAWRPVEGAASSLRMTARLMGPSLAAAVAVPIIVTLAAATSGTGMRVGGYVPFTWHDLAGALVDLASWTLGFTALPFFALLGVGSVTLWLAVRRPNWMGSRSSLYSILILGIPLAAAIVHPGNTGFARYFLCSAIGILLLAAELIGRGLQASPPIKAATALALGSLLFVGLWEDAMLITIERGDPAKIVELMRARQPGGARLALESPRLAAVSQVAAARLGYPLAFVTGCSPADFVVSSEPRRLASPGPFSRCGVTMRPVGSGLRTPLSGDSWVLFSSRGSAGARYANRNVDHNAQEVGTVARLPRPLIG